MFNTFGSLLRTLATILHPRNLRFLRFAPPGHFYSPLPDARDIEKRSKALFDRSATAITGIDLNVANQLALLAEFAAYSADMPFTPEPGSGRRYYLDNGFFSYGDGLFLYAMLRHFRPRRVVEVGSGFSSAVMLDTNELFLGGAAKFDFIEPFPQRLHKLLSAADRARVRIEQRPVQDVSPTLFEALGKDDMLFIDSSHVVKIGSDVHYLLFDVLPRLADGVIVHFHDILWPFEYPENWLSKGRAWNEAYMLRAFLHNNREYEVLLFNAYLAQHHAAAVAAALPQAMTAPSQPHTPGHSSLWLRVQRAGGSA